MITTSVTKGNAAIQPNGLIDHAKNFLKSLVWLSPTESLIFSGSKDFGRSIEKNLNELSSKDGVMRLQLRNRDAAVVMSIAHYEEMIQMKEISAELIERVKDKEIQKATDDYEELYLSISSQKASKAGDMLFSATADDLRKSYQPGRTETE
jgi:hypothetical protein